MRASSARSIRRGFSFTTTARYSEPVLGTASDLCTSFLALLFCRCEDLILFVRCTAFLPVDRLKQLQGKPQQKRAAEDAVAAVAKAEEHPTRSVVERLIADDAAWRSVYDEWKKLVDNKANWEDLAAMLAKNGARAVDERLRTVYGLTPGAASALVTFMEKAIPVGMCLMFLCWHRTWNRSLTVYCRFGARCVVQRRFAAVGGGTLCVRQPGSR